MLKQRQSTTTTFPRHHLFSSSVVDPNLTTTVEKLYRILRRHHSDPTKLSHHLTASKVPLHPPSLLDLVLRRCGPASTLAFSFFSWASLQPSFQPTHQTHALLLSLLSKSHNLPATFSVLDHLNATNPSLLTAQTFVVLIRNLSSSRLASHAIQLLDRMPAYGVEPDSHLFGTLIDALCKHGNVKNAAKVFEELRIRFPPDIKHFTCLLNGWCREGKLMEAKHVLVQMRECGFDPDIVVYNVLLNGYATAGKMEDAYALLEEMTRKGCEPNAVSYTTLVQALCSADRMEEAIRVFAEMKRVGCRADVVAYTTLVSGFCKWGRIDRALELVGAMVQEGCEPNETTYFCLMGAYEKKGKLEECVEVLNKMKRLGCLPDLKVYNVVIRLACRLGDLRQVTDLWCEVEENPLTVPGLDSFVILVNGFTEQGALVEASGYFKEMIGRGLWNCPHYGTLKVLLNALLRDGKLHLAEDVWRCVVEKGGELNVCAWTIWIHALFSRKYTKEACEHCMDMLDKGLMPQPDTFAKLMKGLKRLFNRHIAADLTEKVRKMAEEREVSFKAYKRRGVRILREKVDEKRNRNKESEKKKRKIGAQEGRRRSSNAP